MKIISVQYWIEKMKKHATKTMFLSTHKLRKELEKVEKQMLQKNSLLKVLNKVLWWWWWW
jgi:hypothetical protein